MRDSEIIKQLDEMRQVINKSMQILGGGVDRAISGSLDVYFQLEALKELLISKGLVTKEEIVDANQKKALEVQKEIKRNQNKAIEAEANKVEENCNSSESPNSSEDQSASPDTLQGTNPSPVEFKEVK